MLFVADVDCGDCSVAKSGGVLCDEARSCLTCIFAKNDIAHPVEAIFDLPMATIETQQPLGAGFLG